MSSPGNDVVYPYRKIIRICAEDSPNVRLALAQQQAGITPTGRTLIPGVLSWEKYQIRRELWDAVRQCIGLDAQFYEGGEVLLYPPVWLNRAEELARTNLKGCQAEAIGIDPAEGGDKTAMSAVCARGLIAQTARRTPNTNDIVREVIAFGTYHGVPPERWIFDRGGGGKQHADRLREMGYMVATVGFGEPVTKQPTGPPGVRLSPRKRRSEAQEAQEERYIYLNRRAEMYGEVRERLDPSGTLFPTGFAISASFKELRRQMALIPLLYTPEGRLKIPPKRRRPGQKAGTGERTLEDILGNSPDELDSLVLAVYGLRQQAVVRQIGAAW